MCNCDKKEKIEELSALVHHMKHHTEHHTEEIVKLAESAESLGFKDAEEALKEAKIHSDKLIEALAKACAAIEA